MNKFKKCIISMTVLGSMVFTIIPAYADWQGGLYTQKKEDLLAQGVTHEHIMKFKETGWTNIHVLRKKLDATNTKISLLTNTGGIGEKASLSKMANQRPNLIGGINGDFFSMTYPGTLGPMVEDGKLITTPFYIQNQMSSFNISSEGNPFITYWEPYEMEFINNITKNEFKFSTINKSTDSPNTAIAFTPDWGKKAPNLPAVENTIQIIVQNDIIINIVSSKEGAYIPENGYVLWATGSFAQNLSPNFVTGDSVTLDMDGPLDFTNLSLSMGAGAVLVKDGLPYLNFSHDIKGNHPRTALGITADQSEVLLVTVDGRTNSYTGVSQSELAHIMLSLGAYEAVNLDGGGSTEMVLRNKGEINPTITNNLSEGSERRLVNGIGITNTAPASNEIGGMVLKTTDSNIFVDSSRKIEVKAYDTNNHPMAININDIHFSVEGVSGEFTNNIFIPKTAGEGFIKADYNGASAHLKIKVLADPVELITTPNSLILSANEHIQLTAKLKDKDGYTSQININDLSTNIPNNLINIDANGVCYGTNQGGSGVITASFKNLSTQIPFAVGYNSEIINDFESLNASFLAYPAEVIGSFNLSPIHHSGKLSGELAYNFSQTDATRAAYILFDNGGIPFEKQPRNLGMWVQGDQGGNHWLRAKIVDGQGMDHTITLSRNIDWTGWKYVEVPMPTNITMPIKLERIYLTETDSSIKDSGKIYIDDITACYSINLPKVEKTKDLQNDKASLLDLKLPLVLTAEKYNITKSNDSTFITLDNTQYGFRKTDFAQWPWLINTLNNNDSQQLVILLPKPLNFIDKLEQTLFEDTLKEYQDKHNAKVWVVSSGCNEIKITPKDGIRYVSLRDLSDIIQ
ncbi:phosphodiester glycosidase family protein [Lutibacter sp. B2]|nr:phosphodiester glycosidase family protein [Lutibacter sp. B2]